MCERAAIHHGSCVEVLPLGMACFPLPVPVTVEKEHVPAPRSWSKKTNFLSTAEKLRAALISPNEKAEGHLKIRTAASLLCLGAVKYVFQGKHHSRA